jgi:predicted RNase H-like HicB family nuclease
MIEIKLNFVIKEVTFLVHQAVEGGYHAEAVGIGIFAEGETIEELKESIKGGMIVILRILLIYLLRI